MLWLIALLAAAFVIAIFAFAGGRVKGARPVANTQLMMVGRVLIAIVLAIVALYAFGVLK
jgi:uncharacterized membrane protein YidH (DUF202 family)